MGLIQTGLGIASDILGKCGEDKAKAIVDAISDALPNWLAGASAPGFFCQKNGSFPRALRSPQHRSAQKTAAAAGGTEK